MKCQHPKKKQKKVYWFFGTGTYCVDCGRVRVDEE